MSTNRLAAFENELLELTHFFCNRSGYAWPTSAGFEFEGDTGNVGIYTEDLHAFEKAGYTIKQSTGPIDPPINVILHPDRDRIEFVISPDGKMFRVTRTTDRKAERTAAMVHTNDVEDKVIKPFGDHSKATAPARAYQELAGPQLVESQGTNIFTKITAVMAEVTRVEKTKKVGNLYTVATGDDLLDMLRPIMAKHNLACIPNMDNIEIKGNDYIGYFTFTLACGDTGQTLEKRWWSQISDSGDKAINKVSRAATRYFLTNLFQLTTGDVDDDPELTYSETGKGNSTPKNKSTANKSNTSKPATKAAATTKPTVINFFVSDDFHYGDFFKGIADQFNAIQHRDNALGNMITDGQLKPTMTVAEAIEAVKNRKALEGEAQS